MRSDDNKCPRISLNVDAYGCSQTYTRRLANQTKPLEKTEEVGDKLEAE